MKRYTDTNKPRMAVRSAVTTLCDDGQMGRGSTATAVANREGDTDREGSKILTDGGKDVTVAVYHEKDECVFSLERLEAGFVALLITSSANRIDSPNIDEDRIDAMYEAFMSAYTKRNDDRIRSDGENPPREEYHRGQGDDREL